MDFRKLGLFLMLIGGIGFVSALIWVSMVAPSNSDFFTKLFCGLVGSYFGLYSPTLVWISVIFIAVGFAVRSSAIDHQS